MKRSVACSLFRIKFVINYQVFCCCCELESVTKLFIKFGFSENVH